MARDYRLYELNDEEFERLVVKICAYWLGAGVTPFAAGKDGGRDGKFAGKANEFPSTASPLEGHCVLQAKHVSAPNKSCSDRDFERLLKKEHAKIKALIKDGICDHYIVFTNRKLTGGADQKLVKELKALGLKSAHIVAVEMIDLAVEKYADIRDWMPNQGDVMPFRFAPDDLVEVIGAVGDFAKNGTQDEFHSATDFDSIKIKTEKNTLNGLSKEYYEQLIVNGSMPHFQQVELFLKNPRNRDLADIYHDAADELKAKILVARAQFETFDAVFAFLYEAIQKQREKLKGKRRMVSIMLHYMYFNCDIGSKDQSELAVPNAAS